MTNIIMQFLYTVLKEVTLGVIITWCAIFSVFGQSATQQSIIENNAKPTVFTQEGVASTANEWATAFMPDGRTVYFTDDNKICVSKMVNAKWTRPTVVSFSGHWKDYDPALSPDGKRLIFVSDRPLEGMPQDKPQKNHHLWYSDRLSGDKWSSPKHFDVPINIDGTNDYGPSISRSGTICFCSRNRNCNKVMGGYYAKWLGNHYDIPKPLSLNGVNDMFDPFIAPDESYIIFASKGNLFISYRSGSGWLQGQKLGVQVNNGNANGGPVVSPDGKTLYYSQDHAPGIMMIAIHIPQGLH